MSGMLDGKAGLVTGAGRGIGRASAMAFAREGGRVLVADVDAAAADETAKLIGEAGGEAMSLAVDVSDRDQVRAMVAAVLERWGRLDCAHNNAATHSAAAPAAEFPVDEWHRILEINLSSVFHCMQAEIPAMVAGGGGAIVNTSSTAGLRGVPGMSAYVASKHGVVGLTKVAAIDHATDGVRVNALCPGWTETPMVTMALGDDESAGRQARAAAPVDRLADPDELAEAAVWLMSDRASFCTGSATCVDGGYTAW